MFELPRRAFSGTNPEGKVTVGGSSSVSPVMEKLKEAYLAINTGAQIEIQTTDSTTGVNDAISGKCEIGMSSRELKDTELEQGVIETTIATDGIAVIINKGNEVSDLTKDQIKEIPKHADHYCERC